MFQCVGKRTRCNTSYERSLLSINWLYMFRTITSPSSGTSSHKLYNALVCSCCQASLGVATARLAKHFHVLCWKSSMDFGPWYTFRPQKGSLNAALPWCKRKVERPWLTLRLAQRNWPSNFKTVKKKTTHSDARENDSAANRNTNATALRIIIYSPSYLPLYIKFKRKFNNLKSNNKTALRALYSFCAVNSYKSRRYRPTC